MLDIKATVSFPDRFFSSNFFKKFGLLGTLLLTGFKAFDAAFNCSSNESALVLPQLFASYFKIKLLHGLPIEALMEVFLRSEAIAFSIMFVLEEHCS